MVTADEIRSRTFLVGLRGFDRDEVKDFLSEVAGTVSSLQARVEELEASAAQADEAAVTGEGAAAAAHEGVAEPATAAHPGTGPGEASPFAEIGQQTQRILEAAQQAGEEIRSTARSEVERELKQARAQAARIIADGERRREEIQRVVDALTGARADLSDDLRGVGRTIERLLRELAPEPTATTVREALAATAREEAGQGAEAPAPAPTGDDEGTAGEEDAGEADGVPEAVEAVPEAVEDLGTEHDVPDAPEDEGDDEEGESPTASAPASWQVEAVPASPSPVRGAGPAAETEPARASGVLTVSEAAGDEVPAAPGQREQQQRTQALTALHPKLVRKLKRGLQDLQNATLDLLRRNPERRDVEPFLPDSSAVQTLAALAEEQLALANTAGIAAGAEAAGEPVSVEASGTALAAQLGSELGGVLVTRLADTLRSGFDAGQGMSALTERVDVVFTRMKSTAAGDVAAVALVRAYEGGQRDAWAAGGITHRRWVRAVEPACTDPRCVDNEAAGPVPVGERFPSRHDAPPVRPGCHCSTAPVRR